MIHTIPDSLGFRLVSPGQLLGAACSRVEVSYSLGEGCSSLRNADNGGAARQEDAPDLNAQFDELKARIDRATNQTDKNALHRELRLVGAQLLRKQAGGQHD